MNSFAIYRELLNLPDLDITDVSQRFVKSIKSITYVLLNKNLFKLIVDS